MEINTKDVENSKNKQDPYDFKTFMVNRFNMCKLLGTSLVVQ